MRIKAGQLSASLKNKPLAPLYLISGDEPLQLIECADQIRHGARTQGYEERLVFDVEPGFDWNLILQETATASLFAPKRIVELRLGENSPGKEGGAVLTQYAARPAPDTVLIISSARLDKQAQKTKWFSALDQAGVSIQVWPLTPDELPAWIRQRLSARGRAIEEQALALFAEQVEGNLLAAIQEIDKLCLLSSSTITMADVTHAVADNARYEVFALLEAAMSGDAGRCVHMLAGLRAEGLAPAEIHGPLLWEFRRVCSMAAQAATGTAPEKLFTEYKVWNDQRKRAITTILRRCRPRSLQNLLRRALHLGRMIRSADQILAWQCLQDLLLAIAGKSLMSATGTGQQP